MLRCRHENREHRRPEEPAQRIPPTRAKWIVKDRNLPVARISPYRLKNLSDEERQLAASGVLKLPEKETTKWDKFWDEFWALPSANLSEEAAMRAVLEERAEGR